MVFENPKDYRLTSIDVINEIMELDYRLPTAEEFQAQMKAQKIAAVEVTSAPQADFIAFDRFSFFKYLRVSGIRGVMYSYGYYTAADIDRCFDLQDADKAFFRKKKQSGYFPEIPASFGYGNKRFAPPRGTRMIAPDETEYENYLLYCKYLRLALDLSFPKLMEIYALQNGKVLCCRLEDPWLERLALPNAAMIKAQCLNTGTARDNGGDGLISFRFDYIADGEPEPTESEAPAQSPTEQPQDE